MRLPALRKWPCRRFNGASMYSTFDSNETITPWVPPPMKELHLEKSYAAELRTIITENYDILREKYNSAVTSPDIEQSLLMNSSPEYTKVRDERIKAQKSLMPMSIYNEFLRKLYPRNGGTSRFDMLFKLVHNKFPPQFVQYIRGEHLEELIAQSLDFRDGSAFMSLFESLQAAHLPVTTREKAKYIQLLCSRKQRSDRWHHQFTEWRRDFDECTDIGTLNVLLAVACRTRSFKLRKYVEDQKLQYNIPSDRFSHLVEMKYAETPAVVQQHFQAFREGLYTVDGSAMFLIMSNLLRHNQYEGALALLEKLENMAPNLKVTTGSASRNGNILKAIDKISQLTKSSHSVPMGAEYSMYHLFFTYWVRRGDFTRAIDIMVRMADQGYFIERHRMYDLTRKSTNVEKRRLLVFLRSVDLVRPGYLTDSLIKELS